jgi:hypothetical protein
MQKHLPPPSRSRALYRGVWLVALALLFGIYHLGKKSSSESQDQQELSAASDNCRKVSQDTVKQMVGSLPGTRVSVALASDAVQRKGAREYSCRTMATVHAPNTDLVVRYDLTLTSSNGEFVLTAWQPHG